MIEKFYIEMIHKEIDGFISETERKKLHRYLETTSEAKKYYAQLSQTSEFLDKMPRLEASPNIKKYVMNSIDVKRYATSRKFFGNKSILTKPVIKLAFAFSLGILCGIFVYAGILQQISERTANNSDLYGSIGVIDTAKFETVKEIPIVLPELSGTLAVKRLGNNIDIQTILNSQQPTEMLIEYDESFLKLVRFTLANSTKTFFDPGEKNVRISSGGDMQFTLSFTDVHIENDIIAVKLFSDGRLIDAQEISL
ncbi:hypothetical protein EH223_21020 [candidate division KSB1 bacterium]|nr:hypothetical protein [candidate division KSB1 bacterium]RQV99737.1 MAG: hypothetical protein EH223_21020 [candidate division KSB1 bacterium]